MLRHRACAALPRRSARRWRCRGLRNDDSLKLQGVDVGVVVVIREIVSGSPKVIGGRVVARQADDHVVEPIGVGFETQSHEQLAERPTLASYERDGDVVSPWAAKGRNGPASRHNPEPSHPGPPGKASAA